MSYASDPATPAKPRPTAVTASSYLLFAVAAAQLIGAIAALATMGEVTRVYEDAYRGTEMEDAGSTIAVVGAVVGAVLGLLFAAGLVVLAIFNNRGKNPSRIVTWVVGGLLLCCSGFGLIGSAVGASFSPDTGADVPDAAEIQDRIGDAVPWLLPVQIATAAIVVLALLVALILLALPPSNDFFRKAQPEWQPPAGTEPGYQAYPAYPAGGTPPSTPPASTPPASTPPSSTTDGPADAPGTDPTAPPPSDERPGGGA